jgi:hypothetical protein
VFGESLGTAAYVGMGLVVVGVVVMYSDTLLATAADV